MYKYQETEEEEGIQEFWFSFCFKMRGTTPLDFRGQCFFYFVYIVFVLGYILCYL